MGLTHSPKNDPDIGGEYRICDLWSCGDYGRHKNMTDEELIAHVRESMTFIQLTKLMKPGNHELAHHIGIVIDGPGGYSVMAVFQSDAWVPEHEVKDYFAKKQRGMFDRG